LLLHTQHSELIPIWPLHQQRHLESLGDAIGAYTIMLCDYARKFGAPPISSGVAATGEKLCEKSDRGAEI